MALFLRQDDNRTEVQKRVAAELQERLRSEKPLEYEKPESSYHQNSHSSRHLAVWLSLAVLFVAALVFFIVALN